MNWYKFSQQHLMFYPWDIENARQRDNNASKLDPAYKGKDGKDYYLCSGCDQYVPEDQISYHYPSSYKQTKYYHPQFVEKEKIEDFVSNMLNTLRKIINPLYIKIKKNKEACQKRGGDCSTYEITGWLNTRDIEKAEKNIRSIPKLQELISFLNNVSYYGHEGIKDLSKPFSSLSTYDMDTIYSSINDDEMIKSFDYFFNKINENISNSFSVPLEEALCQKCFSELKTCDFCSKPLLPGKRNIENDNGESACEECINKGDIQTCSSCQGLFHSDEMVFNDFDEQEYCQSCYENAPKGRIEEYMDEIEEAASENPYPFKKWFGDNDRVYLPYYIESEPTTKDKMIIDTLIEYNYIIGPEDYVKGYCYKNGKPDRPIKIVKVLKNIENQVIKALSSHGYSQEDLQIKTEEMKKFTSELINIFETSPTRKLKQTSNIIIAISQNTMDLAAMSTGRDWTSCMEMGHSTGHFRSVFCEIKEGALIAYLIRKEDKEIEEPLARLLIRRYVNKEGVSIAVPEPRVYGNATDDFYRNVKNWLDEKQKDLPKGEYARRGGDWTDELGDSYTKAKMMLEKMLKMAIMKSSRNWYKKATSLGLQDELV